MAANFNQVILMGNMTRDIEVRFTPSNTAVGTFGLAVNRTWTTPQGEKRVATLKAGETFGEIESVKAVADLNAPITGTVSEININVEEHLEVLSRDPWNAGWLIKVKPDSRALDGENLMDAAAYEAFIAASKH